MITEASIWHDVECGGYEADLPVWLDLARGKAGPVLDVGAGTGRVAIPLAQHGHEVTALDCEQALLDVLLDRARGLPVLTACADARDWVQPLAYGLIIVPMQTIQLFGGAEGRGRFLAAARASLRPGGLLAIAVADMTPPDSALPAPFEPDVVTVGDSVYESRPVCVSRDCETLVIERERTRTSGSQAVRSSYSLSIDDIDAASIVAEAVRAGLAAAGRRLIPAAGAYLGAEVVLLDG